MGSAYSYTKCFTVRVARSIDDRFCLQERWELVKTRPKTALFLAAIIGTAIIPVVVFLFFMSSTIIIGLATFLCIQGTILTMSIAVLLPILACCILFATGLTAFAVAASYLLGSATTFWKCVYRSVMVAVASGANKLNIRGKLSMPSVDCKIARRSADKPEDSLAQGDFPRIRTRLIYTAGMEQGLQHED